MLDVVISRPGAKDVIGSAFVTYDRIGLVGIRAAGSDATLYLEVAALDYIVDEAARATPKGTK